MEEIISLAIENPLARLVLAQCDIKHYLASKYKERELVLATSRAINSIENERAHNLWSGVLLGCTAEFPPEGAWSYTFEATFWDSRIFIDGKEYPALHNYTDQHCWSPVEKIAQFYHELLMSLRFVNIQSGRIMKASSSPL